MDTDANYLDHTITEADDNVSMVTDSINTTDDVIMTPYWPLPFSVAFAAILAVIWFLSFFGNLLVLAVIVRFRGMRTRTNLFLANLALVDFLTALMCMPFSFTTITMGKWVFNDTLCQINGFLLPLVFITSVHTLMYISLHKSLTITKPFRRIITKRCVIIMIILSWTVALTLAVMDIYILNSVEYKPYTTQCGPKYPTGIKGYVHNGIMTLTTYILPTIVIVYSYTTMFREIVAYSKRLAQHSSVERSSILNTQKKAAWTLLIVVICFILCWTPYLIYATYGSAVQDKDRIPQWLNPLCYWFGYLNSAVNPIIYGMRNKSFSTGYKSIACSCFGQKVTTPWTDENSKIWSLRRSSSKQPTDVATRQSISGQVSSSVRKSFSKMADPSLPVVIRKNGKIIRIGEVPSTKRNRTSSIDVTMAKYDVDNRKEMNTTPPSDKPETYTANEETITSNIELDDVILAENSGIETEVKKKRNADPCVDSGNDSDMSDCPKISTKKTHKHITNFSQTTERINERKNATPFRRSFGKKNTAEKHPPPLVDELKVVAMDNGEVSFYNDVSSDVISLPSFEILDSDVIMKARSNHDVAHIWHSTPVGKKKKVPTATLR